MAKKEIAIQLPYGILGDDRCILIIKREKNIILFNKLQQNVPFYYINVRDLENQTFYDLLNEKRWFTNEVKNAVYSLL